MYIHCTVCPSDLSSWGERVESILMALLTFCQRNSSKLASEDKARQVCQLHMHVEIFISQLFSSLLFQNLWFPTFDRVHDLQRKYKNSRNQKLIDCMSMPQSNCTMCNKLNSMLQKISEPVACYMYIMFVLSSTCLCTVMYL